MNSLLVALAIAVGVYAVGLLLLIHAGKLKARRARSRIASPN